MASLRALARYAWRKYVSDGVAASGFNKPDQDEIFVYTDSVDAALTSAINGVLTGSSVAYSTRALMYAGSARPAGSLIFVYNDSTAAYNGVYETNGGTGSGAYTLTNLALPSTFAADLAVALSAIDGFEADIAGKLDNSLATNRLLGRDAAGTGSVEAIALTGGLAFTGSSQISLADAPQATFKGRVAGAGTGTPTDMTPAQAKEALAIGAADVGSVPTDRLLGRDTGGSGAAEHIALTGGLAFTGSSQIGLADAPQATFKGRVAGAGTGTPTDMTPAQAKEALAIGAADVGSVPTDRLLGRDTGGSGAAEHIALTGGLAFTGSSQIGLADMPQATFKGRVAGAGTGTPTDMTVPQARTSLEIDEVDNTADMVKPVSTPQLAEMDARTRRATKKKSIVPLTMGDRETSLWLEDGMLGGRGMTEQMRDSAIGGVISKVIPSAGITPLAVDGDTVVLWRTAEGLIGGPGLTPAMRRSAVSDVIKYVDPAHDITPLMVSDTSVFLWMDGDGTLHGPGLSSGPAPVAADAPIASDGRSLALLRAKLGSLRNGDNVTLKVATILSDSWGEMKQIPLALRNLMTQEWSIAGEGYRPAVADIHNLGPSTYTVSAGWTVVDGNATSSFPYGVGADGKAIHTDLTTETVTWANVTGVEFRIWHYQHGGSFRWRVDAGSWTTVTADSSGTFATVAISGLSNAPHTLEIDTTPNAGRVSIVGLYSTGSGPGIEIERMGNSGTRSYRVAAYLPYMTAPIAQIQPDAVVVMLGTNDQANPDSPPSVYINTLRAGVEAIRAGAPDVGFIFVAPARSDYPGAILPLSQYRDALISFCQADGHEFYNMHDDWFAFDEADALGQWADLVHVSNAGAANLARALDRHFDLKG